jgi:hypothetical protein
VRHVEAQTVRQGHSCSRVAGAALLLAALLVALAPVPVARGAARGAVPVSVSVDASHPLLPVPPDFFGLSFELSSLPRVASYAERGDMVTLLRSLGPGVLRFGGVSADTRIAWKDAATPTPAWATGTVGPADFRGLASLAAKTGWHVLLTLGLGHFEPLAAAREAAAAKAALGDWLEAIEVGNEPNAWALHGLRSEPWSIVQYNAQLAAYRDAIEAAAPGIPLAGPDTSGSSAFENWGTAEVVDQRPALLTGHHYALGCGEHPAPTIPRLLSPSTQQREETSLARYMLIAQRGETRFRLDETNNVSCGGTAGISNTFASALWAAGYLPHVMAAGVAGVNLHANQAICGGYAPLCAPTAAHLAAGALQAQPEWSALLLLRALLGDRPLPTATISRAQPNIQVSALLAADGRLHFVIVDDDRPSARSVSLRLNVGRALGPASILWLTAPSPAALTGVRLGGRPIPPEGFWIQPRRLPHAANRRGVINLRIRPSSAALVTAAARPG